MMSRADRPSTLKRLMAQWVWLMPSIVLAWVFCASAVAARPPSRATRPWVIEGLGMRFISCLGGVHPGVSHPVEGEGFAFGVIQQTGLGGFEHGRVAGLKALLSPPLGE